MHCLSALFSERPPSVKRLSEIINVPPSRASRLLRALEEKHLLARSMHPEDRRKEQVTLTDAGVRSAHAVISLFAEVGGELLGGWRKEFAKDFSWVRHAIAETGGMYHDA
jgi:DNA-binding MarR family transcriptional regulator